MGVVAARRRGCAWLTRRLCRTSVDARAAHSAVGGAAASSSGTADDAEESRRDDGWSSVVGLEIHAQIAARSKLFSGAPNDYALPINTAVAFLDASLPGTLPVLNRRCVEAAVTAALALDCRLNLVSHFDRKHYFYADMPAGYQITQQRRALANDGRVDFYVIDHYSTFKRRRTSAYRRSTRVLQLQLEQDSGKSVHDAPNARTLLDLNRAALNPGDPVPDFKLSRSTRVLQLQLEQDSGKNVHDAPNARTLLDLNSAGCALIEIVTEPNLRDGTEATCLAMELRDVLMAVGVCDGHMEKGQFRVDANVSVNRPGSTFGTKVEIKNINSMRFVKLAIDHEIARQISVLEGGGVLMNETRGFDITTGKTLEMRDKETLQDYRFMPEPNLLPLRLVDVDNDSEPAESVNVGRLRRSLPTPLPFAQKQHWIDAGVLPDDVYFVLLDEQMAPYFKTCMRLLTAVDAAPMLTSWLIHNVQQSQRNNRDFVRLCSPERFTQVIELVHDDFVTAEAGQMVEQYKRGKSHSETRLLSKIFATHSKRVKRDNAIAFLRTRLRNS